MSYGAGYPQGPGLYSGSSQSAAVQPVGNNNLPVGQGLTPAETAAVRASVSGAGMPAGPIGRPTRLYLGDSLTQYSATLGLPISASGGTGFGSSQWTYLWAEWDCESGAGTLTYSAGSKTMQWTPLAGAAGAPVDASKTGMLYVPGGVAGHGVWIVWYGASTAYTSGTATLTVGAAGTQLWQTQSSVQGGYAPWAQAYGRQAFRLAPLPSSCPPGMDGYYGLGGATAADLVDAYWQWGQSAPDTAVIEVGTNDCQGGVPVATFVARVQDIAAKLWALGARYVYWLTVTPRDTDTTAQRAWKANAARLLMAWQTTAQNRFSVVDVAARVTDYAAGASQGKWLANFSLDGIHAATQGAMAMGRAIAELDRRVATQGLYLGSVGDVWDAANNPNGNILNAVQAGSGWMEGTSGTISTGAASMGAWAATTAYVLGQPVITGGRLYVATTAGTSGSTAPVHTAGQAADGTVVWQYIGSGAVAGLATGWTANRQVGAAATVACAKMARTDGVPGDWQIVVMYGAAAAEAGRLLTAAASTGFAAGGQYVLDVECRHILSSALNCLGAQIIVDGTSGAKLAQWGVFATSSNYFHSDSLADPAESLVLSTPAGWQTVAASTNIRAAIALGTRSGGYAVMAIGRTQLRRAA